jgi:hypothetical protein
MEMFDEVAEVRVSPDGKVEKKVVWSAEQTEEMALAIEDLRHQWKCFKAIDAQPNAPMNPKHMKDWWRAVDALGLAESRCKQAFTGDDMSPASIAQYNKWRLLWLTGIGGAYYKADA